MKHTFDFLNQLEKNNNRPWFQENKLLYEKSYDEMIAFAGNVMEEMSAHDYIETVSPKKSLFRIYRDVRFGKDKTPYKTHWGGFLKRVGTENRGGYYYHISPQNSYVVGGFFGPNKEDLLHIRKHIAQDASEFREIVNAKAFVSHFGILTGSQLKTSPRGFDKEHPDVDLLRYKQFLLRHEFDNKETLKKGFPKILSDSFQKMRPFLDYMSDILTTDLNGRRLL